MIKRHSILTAILLCFVAFTQVMAQEMQEPEPLPIDPKVRYGKLSNGLTYYIRHNDQPKDRADFYIAQNVGSILEEDNQRGLAHFWNIWLSTAVGTSRITGWTNISRV